MPTTHQIFALGIVEADALLAVAPLGVVDAGEEVVAGHDQQVLRLSRSYSSWQWIGRSSNQSQRKRAPSGLWMWKRGSGIASQQLDREGGFLLVEGFHHLLLRVMMSPLSIIGMVMAGPRLPGARLMMPLRLVMARMIFSSAMTMPQRVPGRPSLERLMQRMVLAFQNGLASPKMMPGKGTP